LDTREESKSQVAQALHATDASEVSGGGGGRESIGGASEGGAGGGSEEELLIEHEPGASEQGGTEAGLLIQHVGGVMHTDCAIIQNRATARCLSVFPDATSRVSGGGSKEEGDEEESGEEGRQGCIGFFSAHLHIGKCLQELLACAKPVEAHAEGAGERGHHLDLVDTLRKYAVELNHALMLESFHARYGYFFESLHPQAPLHYLPRCLLASEYEWHPNLPRRMPNASATLSSSFSASSSSLPPFDQHEHVIFEGNNNEKHEEAEEDDTGLQNVLLSRMGGEGGGEMVQADMVQGSIAFVGTGSESSKMSGLHLAIDGERGLGKGAWVVHSDAGGFCVLALENLEELHAINIFSGVGLGDGHVRDVRVWVTDTEYDGFTAQRLSGAQMLALKAKWLEVDLDIHETTDISSRERLLVRGRGHVIGSLSHVNNEHMTINLFSTSTLPAGAGRGASGDGNAPREGGGERAKGQLKRGVWARGVKIRFFKSDAAGNVGVVTEIELMAPSLSPISVGKSEEGAGQEQGGVGSAKVRILWPQDGAVVPRPRRQEHEYIDHAQRLAALAPAITIHVEWRIFLNCSAFKGGKAGVLSGNLTIAAPYRVYVQVLLDSNKVEEVVVYEGDGRDGAGGGGDVCRQDKTRDVSGNFHSIIRRQRSVSRQGVRDEQGAEGGVGREEEEREGIGPEQEHSLVLVNLLVQTSETNITLLDSHQVYACMYVYTYVCMEYVYVRMYI
jgi:hypothetical protein